MTIILPKFMILEHDFCSQIRNNRVDFYWLDSTILFLACYNVFLPFEKSLAKKFNNVLDKISVYSMRVEDINKM